MTPIEVEVIARTEKAEREQRAEIERARLRMLRNQNEYNTRINTNPNDPN